MADWGWHRIRFSKAGIDGISIENGRIQLTDYTTKLIVLTSACANINGSIDWLNKIQYTNHRVELALKMLLKPLGSLKI